MIALVFITHLLLGVASAPDDVARVREVAPSDTCRRAEPDGSQCQQEPSAGQEEYHCRTGLGSAAFPEGSQRRAALIQRGAAMLKESRAALSGARSLGTLNAYWNMDEEEEESFGIVDISGNGYTLTRQHHPQRDTRCFTVAGKGLSGTTGLKFYPGADRSFADTPSVLPFSHTISFWIQRNVGCCARRDNILRLFYSGGAQPLLIVKIHSTKLKAKLLLDSSTPLGEAAQEWPLATSESYKHVAVVIGTASWSLFVDGQLHKSVTNSGVSLLNKSGSLRIQLGTGADANQFDGEVDDVRLYSEALSSAAIAELYDEGGRYAGYNYKPRVDVGVDQVIEGPPYPTSATLSGECTDVDGPGGVTASWALTSQPAGASATVEGPDSPEASTSFGPGGAPLGDYVFTLTCSDGAKASSESTTISVVAHPLSTLSTWYRFEEPLGMRRVTDDTGYGSPLTLARYSNSGQYYFAEMEPGKGLAGGGALWFQDRSFAAASGVAPFRSVSLWMKRVVGCCSDIAKIAEAKRSAAGTQYFLLKVDGDQIFAEVFSADEGAKASAGAALPPATSEVWVHVAVVFDTQVIVLYLDGAEVAASASSSAILTDLGSESLTLQLGTGGPHHQYRGLLDEVRLYAGALTNASVSELQASGASGGGMLPDEAAPIRADAGPTLTLWLPAIGGGALSSPLRGSCEGGSGGVTGTWALTSSPVGAPTSSVKISCLTSAASAVLVESSATPGDYVLTLTCTEGEESRTSEAKLVVFPPHAAQAGSVVESHGNSLLDLPGVGGSPSAPVGMWLFDGDLSDQGSGNQTAVPTQIKGSQTSWGFTEGRFGQGLELNCSSTQCAQLNLGNAETTGPWTAMSVSLWFKSPKHTKLEMVRKYCGFNMETPAMTADWEGSWHHYVTVFDKNLYKKYLDGLLVYIGTSNHSTSGLTNAGVRNATDAAEEMWLGFRTLAADCGGGVQHPSYGFDGVVDEILVFDYMLTIEEVEVLHRQGAAALVTRPAGNPYSRSDMPKSHLQTYYPEIPLDEDYAGFFQPDPSALYAPAPYVHPRLCFGPDELPSVRERLRNTAAGRVAMENTRAVLADAFPYADLEVRNFTFEELRKFPDGRYVYYTQLMILESLRALIDGDRTVAERLGQQLDNLTDTLLPYIESYDQSTWASTGTRLDDTDTWKDYMHDSVLRTAVAFMYDFLYPYLPRGTRDKARAVIAKATQNTWSIGMDAPMGYKALTSNWIPLVSFDLALNLLAIKGEDGFDQGVFDRMLKVFHGWTTLGVSRLSGASFEGGGKNSLGGTTLLLMAKHGYPQYIASAGARKHTAEFLLHLMLPNGLFFEDDKWGQMEAMPNTGDTSAMKFAFPENRAIDFVYRMSVRDKVRSGVWETPKEYNSLTWPSSSFFGYNNILLTIIHALDFSGPADLLQHEAEATAEQPLTKVFEDLGLLIARSAWADREAAWFALNVRSLPGGHAASARGEFLFHALNESWAFYPHSGGSAATELHSVILVDGDVNSQTSSPGKFLSYVDKPEASWASCDLRYAYSKAEWTYETPNYFLVEPITEYPWMDLPWNIQPQWYTGIRQGWRIATVNKSEELSQKLSSFQRAFRTGGLVRSGSVPYALIFDDFQKNSASLQYTWQMALKPHSKAWDPVEGKWVESTMDRSHIASSGNDIVLEGTESSSRLLVRLLPGSSTADSIAINQADVANPKLEIKATGPYVKFRVLLYPMRPTDVAPTTSWDANASTLTVGQDELALSTSTEGLTKVMSLRQNGGAPIIFLQQEEADEAVHVDSS